MGWLRDIVGVVKDIATDPDVRAAVREAVEAAKLGREVSRRLTDGLQERDVVSIEARKAVESAMAEYDRARIRLFNRFGGVAR